ncbi:SET domain-containing protein [Coniophora puteana RWD-64-598 SS2]|uniref:Histone-lysine N-methyltransferase, H3 lysine-36 specific n=1 Tax=Coniophora puteana (strain RWD-64-598) TaxID=741705 RepID=A0A5M3MC46_CONPW|nr:SET domain-containing protein [Coniophora puteana RWD-64-598 SS2]EIW76613.1 SET domain-containing protein [Coniophora puteana RWD-64-598 SS2]
MLAAKSERSESSTPVPVEPDVKPRPKGPQLIGDLPRAEAAAMSTFVELPGNHYQYGTLGRAREAFEGMACDCQFEPGVSDPSDACGPHSDCINRLTEVECIPGECRCRNYCQNQRFQRKQYANIEVVQTEKKGFGLRAGSDIPKDAFIYEYVGDVVSHPSFLKRMREYAAEGIRHFYFMMLQSNEYIDATKRGGKGRFANHSCNPNCYVAKWTVGPHVRMGIFAKRAVKRNEELTFNYNVDRYGHDPQPCYCGEPQCVGFIGGKTQTDIAGMDDLYLDALGISDEVEKYGLKGSKKKKGRKLDEDYMPELTPILLKDIPKVAQAVRKTPSKKMLFKLLTRIKLTEDQAVLRQFMRLRGFSLMTNIFEDYEKEEDIVLTALECMVNWPLIQRNKVDDSKIRIPVQNCLNLENETIKGLAQKLLDYWDTLEVAYRIPKRIADGEIVETETVVINPITSQPSLKRVKVDLTEEEERARLHLPTARGWQQKANVGLSRAQFVPPPPTPPAVVPPQMEQKKTAEQMRMDIAAVIAQANAAAEAEARAQVTATAAKPPPIEPRKERKERKERREKREKKRQSAEEKEAGKEKRLMKLVGAVVVKCMSKHSKHFDRDQFKKYAKELTQVITEKEKKSNSYKENKLDSLSEEKTAKIKKFAKDYIAKVIRKLDKSKLKSSSLTSASATASTSQTPAQEQNTPEHEGGGGNGGMTMSVENALEMDESDSEPEDADGDADGDAAMADPSSVDDDALHSHSSDDVAPSPIEGVALPTGMSVTPLTPPDPEEKTGDADVEMRSDS